MSRVEEREGKRQGYMERDSEREREREREGGGGVVLEVGDFETIRRIRTFVPIFQASVEISRFIQKNSIKLFFRCFRNWWRCSEMNG